MPHSGLTRRHLIVVLLILLFVVSPAPSLSQPPTISTLTETNHAELLSISSDQEAASLFLKFFGQHLHLASDPQGKAKKSQRVVIAQETTHEIFQIMAHLVMSLRAKKTQSFLQPMNIHMLQPLLNTETAQFQWMRSKLESDTFTPVVDLAKHYLQLFQSSPKRRNQPPAHFQVFANYFDQTFPQLFGSPTSWVAVFENGGASAIHGRFNEFWERPRPAPQKDEPQWKDDLKHKESIESYYLQTRLLPVFSSHLLARLIDIQAVTEYHARQSLLRLREHEGPDHHDPDDHRLCGTWHWTVHNHQNHRDHKMKLSFLPPSQQPATQPQPDVIIIHGDTVYLKWEFQSGFQEDSLLLSNRDQRLEGTFRNSLGAKGTITGKRLTTCPVD